MQGFRQGTIVHRQVWTPGSVTLRLEAATEPLIPGQFHNLALQVGDKWVRRAYSAASAPGQPLEFFVNRVDDGELTPDLTELSVGTEVFIDPRPRGFFTLASVPEVPDLWLWATGTGLAPYISMLRTPEPFARFERVVLVHGVRQGAQLAYAEELEELGQSRPQRFVRIPVVSRENVVGALQGRVTGLFAGGTIERQAGVAVAPDRSHVMLCGNPAMITEMVELLDRRGLRRNRSRRPGQVTFERYW
ncbi:MAG: ferredoxin--NADP reductase [Polyangiaceae bacterium]|nr:ferredoxin--NADP reductase [Polyangiaceae bacterium]